MCVLGVLAGGARAVAQVAVRGETVYTVSGAAIADGVVVLTDGKIAALGRAGEVKVPAGYRLLTAKVVTPGLIDAHSTVGLTGYMNQAQDQDQIDDSEPMQPELRAVDAYNPNEKLVTWLRQLGVTTIHTGHAPGAPISGQTMVVKTWGNTVEDAVLVAQAMIAVTLGEQGIKRHDRWERGRDRSKLPGTRSKTVALLRSDLVKAQDYARKQESAKPDKKPDRDLRLEVLRRALAGELPLLITAHKSYDIITALRMAREFNLKIVLDGAAEAYLVFDEIKQAGVPVIVHPSMMRPGGEAKNASMETAAKLREAGILFAFQSGYENYVPKTRVVLFEAAVAAAFGLSFDDTLRALTIDAAKILGIDQRVGSLEIGKDADLALFDGDPFEYTTHCTGVIINGHVVSEQPH